MASDFDGLRWRPFCKSQSFTLTVQASSAATWVASVDEFVPICSWVSSAYWWKETVVFLFDNSELGWMSLEIGDIKRTNRRGPKTEPCGTPVGEGVWEEDDVSTLTWDERSDKYEWIQEITHPDRPKVCSSLWKSGMVKSVLWLRNHDFNCTENKIFGLKISRMIHRRTEESEIRSDYCCHLVPKYIRPNHADAVNIHTSCRYISEWSSRQPYGSTNASTAIFHLTTLIAPMFLLSPVVGICTRLHNWNWPQTTIIFADRDLHLEHPTVLGLTFL